MNINTKDVLDILFGPYGVAVFAVLILIAKLKNWWYDPKYVDFLNAEVEKRDQRINKLEEIAGRAAGAAEVSTAKLEATPKTTTVVHVAGPDGERTATPPPEDYSPGRTERPRATPEQDPSQRKTRRRRGTPGRRHAH